LPCNIQADVMRQAAVEKKSRRYIHLSQVYRRVSEQKCNKHRGCLRDTQVISPRDLRFESTAVIRDRRGAADGHEGAYGASEVTSSGGVQRLGALWLCTDAYLQVAPRLRKCWKSRMKAIRARPAGGVGTSSPCRVPQRTYRCKNCGLIMDPNAHSAVHQFQAVRFSGSRPHTGDPVRCAGVFTATDNV
jgi:hypothetical protein